jgi:hypothetical protein
LGLNAGELSTSYLRSTTNNLGYDEFELRFLN